MPVFGPGSITLTIAGGTAEPFEFEVTGGSIQHAYEETEKKARLGDTAKPAPIRTRGSDALRLSCANDLSATGLYSVCQDNDLAVATMSFIPNTVSGASWSGDVTLALPEEIGASEWGAEIESEFTFQSASTDNFTFTPAVAAP
jgi:hypothetical protein